MLSEVETDLAANLQKAADLVSALPIEVRAVAFTEAFRALIGPEPHVGNPSIEKPRSAPPAGATAVPPSDDLGRLARAFGIEPDEVRFVISQRDGALELEIPRQYLPDGSGQATRDIAVVLGTAMEALGAAATVDQLKNELRRHSRYVANNFSRDVTRIDPTLARRQRDGGLVVLTAGRERARELMARYVGRPDAR